MTEYANPDVLVSTDWLEAQLDDPDVRVIEVRRQPPVGQRQGALAAALLRPWAAGQAHPGVRRLGHHDASVVEQDAASGTSPDTNGSDIGNRPGMLIPPIPVERLMIKALFGVAAPRRGPAWRPARP